MPGIAEVEDLIIKRYIKDVRLFNSLVLLREAMEIIWANDAPRIIKNYTDHGEKHCEEVQYFAKIPPSCFTYPLSQAFYH